MKGVTLIMSVCSIFKCFINSRSYVHSASILRHQNAEKLYLKYCNKLKSGELWC